MTITNTTAQQPDTAAELYKQARVEEGAAFLAQTEWRGATREFLTGDSSIRSYERLRLGSKTAILMNAPLNEAYQIERAGMSAAERIAKGFFATRRLAGHRIDAFICIGEWLRQAGLKVPQVYAYDDVNGFAILEDFGDAVYWNLLEQSRADELAMYEAATDVLIKIDQQAPPTNLAYQTLNWQLLDYDQMAMDYDANLCLEWFLEKHCGVPATPDLYQSFHAALHQMYGALAYEHNKMILRDYHSPNLMWLPQHTGTNRVGVLDYQDNLIGNPAFNLMFLLTDTRRVVAPEIVAAMKTRYFNAMGFTAAQQEQFMNAYAVYMAINNTRVITWPLRMKYSKGLPQYMVHLPRILGYLQEALTYPACAPLKAWFNEYLPNGLPSA